MLTQIEACLNSRPLTALPCDEDGGIQALTPGHFLIGRPLEALPDPDVINNRSLTLLKRWHLCQALVKHFWQRWSREYLACLQRVTKWRSPSTEVSAGDVAILCDDGTSPTQWPLAKTYPGNYGTVRVVTVQTSNGSQFTHPAIKISPLLPLKT